MKKKQATEKTSAESQIEFTELRAERDAEGKPAKLVGYAAVFNSDSRPVKTKQGHVFIERIMPGAFADELSDKQREVRATVLHNQDIILGRRSKGTVTVSEDKHGLRAEIIPPDTTAGRDAFVQVERGDLDRMSFGFSDMDARTEKQKDGTYLRTISKIKGFKEITLADDRAIYPDTEIHVRCADEAIEKIEKAATMDAAGEQRAMVEVEDPTLQWCCQSLTRCSRDVAAAMDGVMSACERMNAAEAELTNDDRRAIDDAYNAARDLRRRIAPTLAALDGVGAANDDLPAENAAGAATEGTVGAGDDSGERAKRDPISVATVDPRDRRHVNLDAIRKGVQAHNAKYPAAKPQPASAA